MAISEHPAFSRLGIVLTPNEKLDERLGVLNPACTRLRDGRLHLYPRMVAPGNVSRIGSFHADERSDGALDVEPHGYALEPQAPYEFRTDPGGHGCEDPRVTFVPAIDRYVMLYVALGPQGPAVAAAVSTNGLTWERLGLLRFRESGGALADKDAAFFPEPVRSPSGIESLAFYHRPTLAKFPEHQHEGIAIGYIPLAPVKKEITALCAVSETRRLLLPPANWGRIKVGGGTPPVRIAEGWLAVIHGVDPFEDSGGKSGRRYCAGVIIHDAQHLDRILYRSTEPLFVPELPGEIRGTVGNVVFPTGIDPHGERVFDIYYGMADYEIARGRMTLPAVAK